MTLVYMEREYSSAEDPHEGIVHLVEVKNLVSESKKIVFTKYIQKCTVVAIQVSLSHCRRVSGTLRQGTLCPVRS